MTVTHMSSDMLSAFTKQYPKQTFGLKLRHTREKNGNHGNKSVFAARIELHIFLLICICTTWVCVHVFISTCRCNGVSVA